MMHNVAVLMSTYNGEKYIERQLRSILNQGYNGNINVIIRDDGSSDSTEQIIAHIAEEYIFATNRKIDFHKGKNVGPARSFIRLVNKCGRYDFYFFADQDDIWDVDKIENAIGHMHKCSVPVTYSSSYRVIDYEDNLLPIEFKHNDGWSRPLRTLFYNETPGCTMGMNYEMVKTIRAYHFDKCMMHDSLIMFIASLKGEIIYDDTPRISYRIHEANTLGFSRKKKPIIQWLREKVILLINGEDYDLSELAKKLLELGIDDKYRYDVELIALCRKSLLARIKLICHKDMRKFKNIRWTLSVFFHILFGLY